jgi:hypothetical protein
MKDRVVKGGFMFTTMMVTTMKRVGNHSLRLRTSLLIILACTWYLWMYPLGPEDQPTRLYVLVNVSWKLAVAMVLWYVVSHEMFPYINFGSIVEQAMAEQDSQRALAYSILTLGISILLGLLFLAIVPTLTKW